MRYLTLILLFLSYSQLIGQSIELDFFKALSNSNMETVESNISKRVELCLMDEQDMYSRREALSIINEWIEASEPKSYTELHGGGSKDDKTQYKVAKVTTSQGTFRVFVLVDNTASTAMIKKIQIDSF